MPCVDTREVPEFATINDLRKKLATVEAMLCGVISGISVVTALSVYDEVKSGVSSEELVQWWREHCKKDGAAYE